VALGTVADVVKLDFVNRIFVHQGLLRIRAGKAHQGIQSLISIAKRQTKTLTPADLGFALAPRLNAVGRMDDMSLGIQGFLTDDAVTATAIMHQLDDFNQQRKAVETDMKQQASDLLEEIRLNGKQNALSGICLYNKNWHQGVVGILASRIKEQENRPVIAFAPTIDGEIKGSGRSIKGVHLRDVLAEIAMKNPKILHQFGGHAMAAGLNLKTDDYPAFALAFDATVKRHLHSVNLEQKIYSDGVLSEKHLTLEFAQQLQAIATWGQGFPEPVFHGTFEVIQCRIMGGHHLKLLLRRPRSEVMLEGIVFFVDQIESWQGVRQLKMAYTLGINDYRGELSLQLKGEYLEKII
jgi:single-stranded-DNA-specific exonuclease